MQIAWRHVNAQGIGMDEMSNRVGIPDQGMAQRLRQARLDAGYETASEAARAMGVLAPTYMGHENGTRGITAHRAAQYARFYRISIAWLVTGRGHPHGAEAPAPTGPNDILHGLSPEDREEVIRLIKFLRRRH